MVDTNPKNQESTVETPTDSSRTALLVAPLFYQSESKGFFSLKSSIMLSLFQSHIIIWKQLLPWCTVIHTCVIWNINVPYFICPGVSVLEVLMLMWDGDAQHFSKPAQMDTVKVVTEGCYKCTLGFWCCNPGLPTCCFCGSFLHRQPLLILSFINVSMPNFPYYFYLIILDRGRNSAFSRAE